MNQDIAEKLKLTDAQIADAVCHIRAGEGLTVVAEALGLGALRRVEQDRLVDQLGIFEFAQEVMTSREFWSKHVMDFNFELDEPLLVEAGLQSGFIEKVGDDTYRYLFEEAIA